MKRKIDILMEKYEKAVKNSTLAAGAIEKLREGEKRVEALKDLQELFDNLTEDQKRLEKKIEGQLEGKG